MNESTEVLYAEARGVALITLNRPEVKNAFGDTTRGALLQTLQRAAEAAPVGSIVITGAGGAFSAGGDIPRMRRMQDDNDTEPLEIRMREAAQVLHQIRATPKPVIAAVNGAAAGGGMNLALACDFRFGSEHAFFSASFVKIGLVPDWGGHYFLPRLCGMGKALELMMSGRRIDAKEAVACGLLNEVLDHETFLDEVLKRAEALARGPRETIAAIKRCAYLGAEADLETTLQLEVENQRERLLSAEAREGMRAFIEKRPPQFQGDA